MPSPEATKISVLLGRIASSVTNAADLCQDLGDARDLPEAFKVVGKWLPKLDELLKAARSRLRSTTPESETDEDKAQYPDISAAAEACVSLAERLEDIYGAVGASDGVSSPMELYRKAVKEDETVEGVMKDMLKRALTVLRPLVGECDVKPMDEAMRDVLKLAPSLEGRSNAGNTFNNTGSGVLPVYLGKSGNQNINTGLAPQLNGPTPNAQFHLGGNHRGVPPA